MSFISYGFFNVEYGEWFNFYYRPVDEHVMTKVICTPTHTPCDGHFMVTGLDTLDGMADAFYQCVDLIVDSRRVHSELPQLDFLDVMHLVVVPNRQDSQGYENFVEPDWESSNYFTWHDYMQYHGAVS